MEGMHPMSQATHTTTTAGADARLLALLAEANAAEASYRAALVMHDDEDATATRVYARLEAILEDMASTPATSLLGVAAKAARVCRSLRDGAIRGEQGTTISRADAPVAESLAEDLARLAPEVVA